MPGRTISQGLQAKLGVDLTPFRRGLRRAGREAARAGRNISRRFSSVVRVARNVTLAVAAIGAALAGLGALAVREFTRFEEALTGVAKTTELSAEGLRRLGDDFRALSERIPVATNELLGIAESAGQLGIQSENIRSFTEVMAALGVATNLTARDAATGLARLANVMQTPQTMFDRLGATIVDLGNNAATTEREILQFATRMAGAGQIAGFSEANVLGIGAAMSSVGVEAEAGGTAVQKAIIDINTAVAQGGDKLSQFARVAGESADDFTQLWRRDAGRAFTQFVEGLGRAGNDAATVLEDLGLNNQRLVRAFLSLANAGDVLRENIDRGTTAWEANTALTEEAERFYKRLGARLTSLKNKVVNVASEMGERLAPVVDSLINVSSTFLDRVREMGPAIGKWAEQTARKIPAIVTGFVNAIGTIGEKVMTFVQQMQSSPIFSGTAAAGGLIGYIFLGPLGLAAGVTIGALIDGLMTKLGKAAGGGALTVFDALEQQQERLLNFRKQLVEMQGDGAEAVYGVPIEEAIANVDRQLAVVATSIRRVGEEYTTVGDKALQFFQGLQRFKMPEIAIPGITDGGEETILDKIARMTPEIRLAGTALDVVAKKVGKVKPLLEKPEGGITFFQRIQMHAAELADLLSRRVEQAITSIVQGFQSATEAVESLVKAIAVDLIRALVSAAVKAAMLAVFLPGGLKEAGGFAELFLGSFHSGGVVGGGGQNVPIMAQTGEVVLSRAAVERLGGPRAADGLNRSTPAPAQTGPSSGDVLGAIAGAVERVFSTMPAPPTAEAAARDAETQRRFGAMAREFRRSGGSLG